MRFLQAAIIILLAAIPLSGEPRDTEAIIKSILNEGAKDSQPRAEKKSAEINPINEAAEIPKEEKKNGLKSDKKTGKIKSQKKEKRDKETAGPLQPDEMFYRAGIAFYNTEMYEAAGKKFSEMRSKYPDSQFAQSAIVWSGKVNMKLNKYDKAIGDFSSVSEESGEYPASLFHLGETYLKAGNPAGAINSFYKLSSQFPQYELADEALIRLGMIYLNEQKGTLALDAAAKVIKFYGTKNKVPDAYYLIGKVYERDQVLRDIETARKIYKIFLKKADQSPQFKNSPLLIRVKRDLKYIESNYFRYER